MRVTGNTRLVFNPELTLDYLTRFSVGGSTPQNCNHSLAASKLKQVNVRSDESARLI